MLRPASPGELRRRRLIVLGAAATLVAVATIGYALLAHRSTSATTRTDAGASVQMSTGSDNDPAPPAADLPPLVSSSDPEQFARAVAAALFEWDTAAITGRGDHVDRLVAVADPTGASTPGLLADLDGYLPAPDAWVDLAAHRTRQWLSIDAVVTPTTWAVATRQAGEELLPGTTAFTIDGTRHRAGRWEGDAVTSAHGVTFTVFIVCAPAYRECRLLRLSMLDQPLP